MNLKEIINQIVKKRGLTKLEFAMILNITFAYLIQIQNEKYIPEWFLTRMIANFDLDDKEIKLLTVSVNEVQDSLQKKSVFSQENFKKEIRRSQNECIKKIYIFANNVSLKKKEESMQVREEIISKLDQILQYSKIN